MQSKRHCKKNNQGQIFFNSYGVFSRFSLFFHFTLFATQVRVSVNFFLNCHIYNLAEKHVDSRYCLGRKCS